MIEFDKNIKSASRHEDYNFSRITSAEPRHDVINDNDPAKSLSISRIVAIKKSRIQMRRRNPDNAAIPQSHNSHRHLGQHRLGFTLLELLVVIVIIGLLAAYVGPKYFSQLGKSEITVAKAQMEAFDRALDTFRLDIGRYPTTEEGLASLISQPASLAQWHGPYLKKEIPKDPWGHAYGYRAPGIRADYDLISYGKDGAPGGADANADIVH